MAPNLEEKIRALASERRLPESAVRRWLAMDEASREALFDLAHGLRMRTGQIAAALDTLHEIALREQTTVAAILARDEIKRAAQFKGPAPARASAVLDAVRTFRFPRLKATERRLRAEIKAFKLPAGISVVLPKDLGSDEVTVSLRARGADEFARMLDALKRCQPGMRRMFKMLGGETPENDTDQDDAD